MIAWTLEALVASTLLMAAVLLLRRPVRSLFGAQVAYALWALPALRLLLPSIPAHWREVAATPITRAGETITVLVIPAVAGPAPVAVAAPASIPWASVVGATWLAAAVLFLGWHALAHRRFCRRVLTEAVPIDRRGGIRVVASAAATGPLAFGVVRRYVAFPRDFAERYDAHERELALDHELGHHHRGDLLANWVALAVLAIHWFNPLAWRAFRAFRADQEFANDARVLAGRSRADRHIYACAIVKAAHGGWVSAACHLHTIEDLKGRLKMLTTSRFSRRRLATGAATVSLLGMLGLGLTVSGSQAAAALTETVGSRVGVDLKAPLAPLAPLAPATGRVALRDPVAPHAPLAGQAAPAVPAVPAAPGTPPAPPAPPVGATGNSDVTTVTTKDGRTAQVRVVNRRGTGFDQSQIAQMVNITSGQCGPDNGKKAFVINTPGEGGRRITTICTDRITAAAMAGQMTDADSQDIERKAITAALAGLESSRAGIAANASMGAEGRKEALAGIDEAIKELRSDLANVGKDD